MNNLEALRLELHSTKNPKKAESLKSFFKTGKGDYGEKDEFIGINAKVLHSLSKKYQHLSLSKIKILLHSKIHEERQCALFILIEKYKNKKTSEEEKKRIKDFYLKNITGVNSWDLVDLSAHHILGEWLFNHNKEKKILYKLAKSQNIWKKRIAIVSTFYFIRQNKFTDTLEISKILLKEKHYLIQKAVGWMLREMGKRDLTTEENFLKKNHKKMPPTMLRYAIEKFDEEKRKKYLKKN